MLEIILQTATLLGGIAALWFFWEKFSILRKAKLEREAENTESTGATQLSPATTFPEGRYLEIFICGLSAMAGALVWYGFGVIGSYVWLPLMVLISYILRRTSFIKRGFLKESLMFGTFSAMFGHFLIFCAAVIIAVRGGGLHMDENGVEVLPLMRTTSGLLVAIGAGVVVAVFVMIPVKEGQD